MSFPKMDFPQEKVSSTNCFIDQALISATHQQGVSTEYLPKVTETYGKIIFPHGSKYPFTFDDHPQSRVVHLNHHQNTFFFTRQLIEPAK